MNHPLTDEMIEEIFNRHSTAKETLRAIYDLGRKHEAEWQEGQPENYQLNPLD